MGFFDFLKKQSFKIDFNLKLKTEFKDDNIIDNSWNIDILNKRKEEALKKRDYGKASQLLFLIARRLYEKGENHIKVASESIRLSLLSILEKPFGERKVKIITALDKSCSNCRKLHGKILTVDKALKLNLLPCKKCKHEINPKTKIGWCRCVYVETI